jgi:uracil-DNA glycosylase family 4
MSGFFPEGVFKTSREFSNTSRCGACGLYKKCANPKLSPQGDGHKKILIVLPPITEREDATGRFLRSSMGETVKTVLKQNGISPMDDCHFTSAIICGTEAPTNEQIDHCSFKLKSTIEDLQPNVVIPIGPAAIRSIIQFTWKKSAGLYERWCGYQIPAQTINSWVCPTYVPYGDDTNLTPFFMERHISDALELCDAPPWQTIPNYQDRIELIWSERKLEKVLSRWINKPFVAGFDYETVCLKPDKSNARIVSGSLSFNGRETYAFPWFSNAPGLLKALSRNPRGAFIGSNMKYEERWSKAVLGFTIRNWVWDTMLAAHAIDNRGGADDETRSNGGGGLSSVKFQAFVLLGQPIYDDHLKEYLKGNGSYGLNSIKEIPMKDLLLYNGMDSLLCYLVAKEQMRRMGHPLLKRLKV